VTRQSIAEILRTLDDVIREIRDIAFSADAITPPGSSAVPKLVHRR
jgi:hypothetical protein